MLFLSSFLSQFVLISHILLALGLNSNIKSFEKFLSEQTPPLEPEAIEVQYRNYYDIHKKLFSGNVTTKLLEITPIRGESFNNSRMAIKNKEEKDIRLRFPNFTETQFHDNNTPTTKLDGKTYIDQLIATNSNASEFQNMLQQSHPEAVSLLFTFTVISLGQPVTIRKEINYRSTIQDLHELFTLFPVATKPQVEIHINSVSDVGIFDDITAKRPQPLAPLLIPPTPISTDSPITPPVSNPATPKTVFGEVTGVIETFAKKFSQLGFFQKHFSSQRKLHQEDISDLTLVSKKQMKETLRLSDIFFKNETLSEIEEYNKNPNPASLKKLSLETLFYLYLLQDTPNKKDIRASLGIDDTSLPIIASTNLQMTAINKIFHKKIQGQKNRSNRKKILKINRKVLIRKKNLSFVKKLFRRTFSKEPKKILKMIITPSLTLPTATKNSTSQTMAPSSPKLEAPFKDELLQKHFETSKTLFSKIQQSKFWKEWGLEGQVLPSMELTLKHAVSTQGSPLLSNQRRSDGTLELSLVRETGPLSDKTLSFWMLHELIQDSFKEKYRQSNNKMTLTDHEIASLELVSLIALRNYLLEERDEGEFWRNTFTSEMVNYLEAVYNGPRPQTLIDLDALILLLGKKTHNATFKNLSLEDAVSMDSQNNIFKQLKSLNSLSAEDQKTLSIENVLELQKYA